MRSNKLAMTILCGLMAASPFASAQASDVEWGLTLYGWFPSVSMDANTRLPPTGASSDASFSNVVDKIDGAFLGHVEAQGERFGMFGDILYLGLGDQKDFTNFSTDSQLDSSIWELAGVWNVEPERFSGFELFAGIRYFDISLDLDFQPVNPIYSDVKLDGSDTYLDFMFGVRYMGQISEKWGYILRADGSWGDSDGSENFVASLTYKTESGAWSGGYRYMNVGLPPQGKAINALNPDLSVDISLSGPVVSYTWFIK